MNERSAKVERNGYSVDNTPLKSRLNLSIRLIGHRLNHAWNREQ